MVSLYLHENTVKSDHSNFRVSDYTQEEEMKRLLVHGIFHLLGYDHEGCEEEADRMRAEEYKYL